MLPAGFAYDMWSPPDFEPVRKKYEMNLQREFLKNGFCPPSFTDSGLPEIYASLKSEGWEIWANASELWLKTEANKSRTCIFFRNITIFLQTYKGLNHNLPFKGINLCIDFVISGETLQIELHKILCRNAVDLEREINKSCQLALLLPINYV